MRMKSERGRGGGEKGREMQLNRSGEPYGVVSIHRLPPALEASIRYMR